jgi:Zn2+/Cd2+-exporting ATPase
MTKTTLIAETTATILSAVLIAAAFLMEVPLPQAAPWLFGSAFLIGGFAKAREGVLETVKNKALNVEILMILAALGAFVIGYYSEGAILIIIFAISGVLESYASARSEKELKALLELAPTTAMKVQDGTLVEVPVSSLAVGDTVSVSAGMRIPVDGTVIDGRTSVDQSMVTGESVHLSREPGDSVFAGSFNVDGHISVKTDKDPSDTVVQHIVDFVTEAKANAPKSQSKIERFEKIYVYIVILIATFFMTVVPATGLLGWEEAFYRGIIVLVVGSPCALVASVSPAMLASLSTASRLGILVKGGNHFETLRTIGAVVFDKTGTITSGVFEVNEIRFCDEVDHGYAARVLYTLERQSDHPLARAVTSHLDGTHLLEGVRTSEKPGRGMEADVDGVLWQVGRFEGDACDIAVTLSQEALEEGRTIIPVFKDHVMVGAVTLSDTVRQNAKETVERLKDLGIVPVLLTGDHEGTAKSIAKDVGIDIVHHDCMPEDKVSSIETFRASYGPVMMVGDGINDAPALAKADIGCAMGSAADVSLETSDIVFTNNDLMRIPDAFGLARGFQRITVQNIIFSTSVIVLLMISNVFGIVDLPFGVVAHETSTILVILNSLRLLKSS